jgi:hypothetical protein
MSTLKTSVKRQLVENEVSDLQKKIVKVLEPENLLELEKELREILQAERLLLKLSGRLNISAQRLQKVIEEFLDLISLLQI